MSAPRQILPGKTYLLTRRCSERRFFLSPARIVEAIFWYCLAYAAGLFGLDVHAACVLSNHWHLVFSQKEAVAPAFAEWVHKFVAKCMNVWLGRWENFWAGATTFSLVELQRPEDILDKLVYVACNPVSSGLVKHARDWPGLTTVRLHFGERPFWAERPPLFFRRHGKLPDCVPFQIVKPPGFEHLTDAEFDRLFRERVRTRELELHRQFKTEGRHFLGTAAVRRQDRFASPTTREPRRNLSPRVAAKDQWQRIERLQRLVQFLVDYRAAFDRWRAGDRAVLFPCGTYAMRVIHGARCRGPD